MMEIELIRTKATPQSTTGKMSLDGVFAFYTLERAFKDPDWACIPLGRYLLTLRPSERFKRIMPHLENVPGREGILIHWGNFPKDSEGCVLVGMLPGDDAVWQSKEAFAKLMDRLNASKDDNFVTISNLEGLV